MSMKKLEIMELRLDKIVGGGQALGTLPDGHKLFAWGGLPGEHVRVQLTKMKSNYLEGIVTEVLEPSPERITPKDPGSYLSTSPWQIMSFEAEQRHKAELIKEAFELHGITLPEPIEVYTDGHEFQYRNKVEFSWYGDTVSGADTLDLAFFRRGSKGKIIVETSALLPPEMVRLAHAIRDHLRSTGVSARQLKTLLIRCDQEKNCVWQLYVKDIDFPAQNMLEHISQFLGSNPAGKQLAQGGEVIYSNPKSPASVITERLASTGNVVLTDRVLGVPFRYATEGFFQVNLPVYEQALIDMRDHLVEDENKRATARGADALAGPARSDLRDNSRGIGDDGSGNGKGSVLDLYSGVGSIGLTIGSPGVTLVESNEHAVREMKRNIEELGISATPVLAASEQALEYITNDRIVIVDPPRAGLHASVIERLLETQPPRIIYLSCNPVTQARDVALLSSVYKISFTKGYNFFPRTPHIENLVVLSF